MKINHTEILEFISLIRWSHHSVVKIYTQGGCYNFYKILKHRYPSAIPFHFDGHVYTKIDGRYYDIEGEHEPSRESEKKFALMDDESKIKAEEWVRNAYNKDYIFENK